MDIKSVIIPGLPDVAKMRLAIDRLTLPGPDGRLRLRDNVSSSLACSLLAYVSEPSPGRPSWAPLGSVAEGVAEVRDRLRRLSSATDGWTPVVQNVAAPSRSERKLRQARANTRAAVAAMAQALGTVANTIDGFKKAFIDLACIEFEGLVRLALGITEDDDSDDEDDVPEDAE